MAVTSLTVRQFRCFAQRTLTFDGNVIMLGGPNGSGKTSLLEALYYACYLRSFKTHTPREMAQWETGGFFVGVTGEHEGEESWDIQCTVSGARKTIKVDGHAAHSYGDLWAHYKAIAVTEDSLALLQGAPDDRRSFIDHALFLESPSHAKELAQYRKILAQRNAFLVSGSKNATMHEIWTHQLQEKSERIRVARKELMEQFLEKIKLLCATTQWCATPIVCTYTGRDFAPSLYEQEYRLQRSLWGAHLDDIIIEFKGHGARAFASRGQQKMVVMLFKIAQLMCLRREAVLLIDDFFTDFDETTADALLQLLHSNAQQIFLTTPSPSMMKNLLSPFTPQCISLQ